MSAPRETFGAVAHRLQLVSRVVLIGEWFLEGSTDEALGALRDLEDDLLIELQDDADFWGQREAA